MKNIRTDLALEAHETAVSSGQEANGVKFSESDIDGYKLTTVKILDEQGEKLTEKKRGTYSTLEIGKPWTDTPDEFKSKVYSLSKLIKHMGGEASVGSVLVIGLGNRTITADAIGPYAVEKLLVTRHLKQEKATVFDGLGLTDLAALAPGVLGQTGIESADIIKSVIDSIKPSVLIVIDSLAGRRLSRLATTVQLTDAGIAPGSGVGNHRHEISKENMGIPVVSIGVPTVVDAATLAYDAVRDSSGAEDISYEDIKRSLIGENLNFFVTPKETDMIMSSLATLIAYAINTAFNPSLSYEEIMSLAG